MRSKSGASDAFWWAAVGGEGPAKSPGLPAGVSLRSALEALLLTMPEPLCAGDAASLLGVEQRVVADTLRELAEEYRRDRRGFQIAAVAGGFRLVTSPELAQIVLGMRPESTPYRMSGAARETVAVIAYRQEATRAEIEAVRGVSCEKILAVLLEHGLIEERGRRDAPGRPIVYATTTRFLEHFGLNSLADLPPIPEAADERQAAGEHLGQEEGQAYTR